MLVESSTQLLRFHESAPRCEARMRNALQTRMRARFHSARRTRAANTASRTNVAQNGTMTTAPSPAEETEKWLLVRKSLLLSPKLAKSVQEISESEWIKSRVSSLKRLLEECGNFHGGPKGEMWTALTLALTQHLGSDHEFVELISEHQDSLWATCSLMTVTTLGSETSLDGKVRELEEESENHQLSVSTANSTSVAPTQVYGSIDLIEPAGKGEQWVAFYVKSK